MADINRFISEIREMDELAAIKSPVHSIHPLAKLITTIAYILITVSFDKYDIAGISAMALYPAAMFAASGISIKTYFYKMRFVLPLVCAIGIFNPIFDNNTMYIIGGISISNGVISMITLMIKGVFCLAASFILAASAPIDAICAALRMIHTPNIFVTLILLTYRYIAVMLEEVSIMTDAYKLRAPSQKGIHYSAWGSFLGQLLLRSTDKAKEIYSNMLLRGFNGNFQYAFIKKAEVSDYVFCIGTLGIFILFRNFNIPQFIGNLIL